MSKRCQNLRPPVSPQAASLSAHALSAARPAPRGFTLLELIISVALVLVLMLAITRIFTITSDAVGASAGIAAAARDARAAQAIIARDIGAMASDSPFVFIRSNATIQAYRNALDEKQDKDGKVDTIDVDGNNTEGEPGVLGEVIDNYDVNNRSHRLDRFSFCARDRFSRQTGNTAGNVLVSRLTSSEAWITYGPITLPGADGTFYLDGVVANGKTNPGDYVTGRGAASNPNNYYSSQWILGRFAPLMIRPINAPSSDIIQENGITQELYPHSGGSFTSGANMTPFTVNSGSSHATPSSAIQNARYDLIGIDIAAARDIISNYSGANAWWQNLLTYNFEINPFVTKPLSAATVARQHALFVPACSQFIVEFAGDFCTQDNDPASLTYGDAATGVPTPDGVLDFAVVNGRRQIRWYGYPRDTDSNIVGISALGTSADTVPVSDFVLPANSDYATKTTPGPVPFEHAVLDSDGSAVKTRKAYAAGAAPLRYIAAWGPTDINRPKMYRITLTIDRPEMAGRTYSGLSFEYVFNAP